TMASGLWSEGQIWCPTCLNILTDPVTLPCGHSYCMGCIRTQWDRVDHIGVYSCPQCGETFAQRPDVHRNTELADVVEQLRSSSFHDPPPAPSPAGPGDVLCDVCTGRPARAVKSCLVCLASYCQTHLQPHRQSPALSAHPLVDATGRPGGTARADPQGPWDPLWQMGGDGRSSAVANLVRIDEAAGLSSVRPGARAGDSPSIPVRPHFSPEAVRRAVSGLKERLENFCREELVKISRTVPLSQTYVFRESEESLFYSKAGDWFSLMRQTLAQKAVEDETTTSVLAQACFVSNREFLSLLESSVVPQGVVRVTQVWLACFKVVCLRETPSWTIVGQHTSTLAQACDISDICDRVNSLAQSDACQLTLDPNTAHRHLRLSEGNRRVTWSREPQQYPDHPERFDHWQQVLCREGLSGTRCYWEVEWSGIGGFIGVAYKGITRKGEAKDGVFGGNDQSWSLVSSGLSCSFWHSRKGATITGPLAPRIGVYVDHRAGTLSFYSVSGDTATLLHRVQASFTEPLYPGFGIGLNTTVGLCRL
uniref:Uncharacterized protein n=1 Tax=Lepisosteus oculatus TaxID=7918 RepID=W5MIU3_LEPOC